MKKFATLFGVALMAGSALCAAQAYAADDLTITSWGGAYQESQRNAFFKPFVDAGNKVTEAEYNGEIAKIRAMVEAKAVTWDVVDVDTQTALAGCAEGTFETIDWAQARPRQVQVHRRRRDRLRRAEHPVLDGRRL